MKSFKPIDNVILIIDGTNLLDSVILEDYSYYSLNLLLLICLTYYQLLQNNYQYE